MSLWLDRRAEVQGAGVHALVIGVSDYEFLPEPGQFPELNRITLGLTKVNISATAAVRVASWLKERYWHPHCTMKTVRLLLSPSTKEKELPEVAAASATQPRATKDNVWQAMQDWQNDCRNHPEDIAILYVSGHGIQWGSKDDAIVLLEDFSKDQLFLNWTLDVGKTLKGMSGSDMPQTQFYFVDACRIMPDEFKKYEDAGNGLRLRSTFGGADLRAAPIFYAACPQTAAKGRLGKGTYFAEALTDCLETSAQQGPNNNSSLAAAKQFWHVSTTTLLTALQDRVTEIASIDQETQDVVLGGMTRAAIFSCSPNPPNVRIILDITPDAAAQVTSAELWNFNRSLQIRPRSSCWERPLKLLDVPAGIYLLLLSADPPLPVPEAIAVNAVPPEWNQAINIP